MRPQVLLAMAASVDGRITTGPGRNVVEWSVRWPRRLAPGIIQDRIRSWGADGVVSGSESVLVWSRHPVTAPDEADRWESAVPYIVFDGRGRVEWSQTQGLVVVTRRDVSPSYQEQLRAKAVETVLAGTGAHVDLDDALAQLYARGFRRLALNGGGAINGAFLRAGLVDEAIVVWEPLLVGGTTTPTLFDAPDLDAPADLLPLELVAASPGGGGTVVAHYRIGA